MPISHLVISSRTQKCKKKFFDFHAAQPTVGGLLTSTGYFGNPGGANLPRIFFWLGAIISHPTLLPRYGTSAFNAYVLLQMSFQRKLWENKHTFAMLFDY